ncbi:MAG: TonB family protein [Novosphingobium sp.]|nr:TonB family protein [Novosphingobium sp.]
MVAPPVRPLIAPPPIVAATQAGIGNSVANGAANTAGPGFGGGGSGNGNGGGGSGGAGGGGGTPPQHIAGRLSFADLPEGLLAPYSEAGVGVRYKVDAEGHVSDCGVDQSSGSAALDALTCRLIEQRFRFRPARDEAGRPVDSIIVESHTWVNRPQ